MARRPPIHPLYEVFFLYIEPCFALFGALSALFTPQTYLELTHAPSAPGAIARLGSAITNSHPASPASPFASTGSASSILTSIVSNVPLGTRVVLNQLGNLYLFFALTEALVLRAASGNNGKLGATSPNIPVYRALVIAMLVADFGHLYSVLPIAVAGGTTRLYWDVQQWSAIDWGNLAFVYLGAFVRINFLLGPQDFALQSLFQQGSGAKKPARARASSSSRRKSSAARTVPDALPESPNISASVASGAKKAAKYIEDTTGLDLETPRRSGRTPKPQSRVRS